MNERLTILEVLGPPTLMRVVLVLPIVLPSMSTLSAAMLTAVATVVPARFRVTDLSIAAGRDCVDQPPNKKRMFASLVVYCHVLRIVAKAAFPADFKASQQ